MVSQVKFSVLLRSQEVLFSVAQLGITLLWAFRDYHSVLSDPVPILSFLSFFSLLLVLEIEPRTLLMLRKHSTT